MVLFSSDAVKHIETWLGDGIELIEVDSLEAETIDAFVGDESSEVEAEELVNPATEIATEADSSETTPEDKAE